jgi:hypothetical protein
LFTTKRTVALISLGIDAIDPKLDCSTKTTTLHYALVNVAVNAQLSIAKFVDIFRLAMLDRLAILKWKICISC